VMACVPPNDNQPCFPSAGPEDVPWIAHRDLGWEIDAMASLDSASDAPAPTSDVFARAERDLKTEFYLEAAKGLLSVVRGDTKDTRAIRQTAQFHLAIAVYRMKYYAEAHRLFHLIATTKGHPARGEAAEWDQRQTCAG